MMKKVSLIAACALVLGLARAFAGLPPSIPIVSGTTLVGTLAFTGTSMTYTSASGSTAVIVSGSGSITPGGGVTTGSNGVAVSGTVAALDQTPGTVHVSGLALIGDGSATVTIASADGTTSLTLSASNIGTLNSAALDPLLVSSDGIILNYGDSLSLNSNGSIGCVSVNCEFMNFIGAGSGIYLDDSTFFGATLASWQSTLNPDLSTTPTNTVTPVGWIQTTVNGVTSWIPYYQ